MTRPIKDAARPELTSSSFSMIMEKALKMEVVGPARVMILSGQFPSEMLMRAPLCRDQGNKQDEPDEPQRYNITDTCHRHWDQRQDSFK